MPHIIRHRKTLDGDYQDAPITRHLLHLWEQAQPHNLQDNQQLLHATVREVSLGLDIWLVERAILTKPAHESIESCRVTLDGGKHSIIEGSEDLVRELLLCARRVEGGYEIYT